MRPGLSLVKTVIAANVPSVGLCRVTPGTNSALVCQTQHLKALSHPISLLDNPIRLSNAREVQFTR